MEKKLKIAGVSLNQIPLDWNGNTENIITAIRVARLKHVNILCFPELCLPGYGCEDLFLSHWLPDKALDSMEPILKECKDMTAVIGIPVRYLDKTYNCACIIRNEKIIGIYAKQFLANDGVHYEPRWFTPWEADKIVHIPISGKIVPFGDIQIEVEGIKTGFEICEDAWQPNRPAHRLKQKGVKLILNPSASHFSMGKSETRKNLVLKSSKDFNCTYLYVNLLGNEAGRMIYDGEILIAQEGELLRKNRILSFLNINLVMAEINFSIPFLSARDRLEESLSKFSEFNHAASLGLFDYLRKSKNKGFVISLSGGADSATCTVLVSEMVRRGVDELGIEKFLDKLGRPDLIPNTRKKDTDKARKYILSQILTCVYQSSENSSDETLKAAKELASEIGCEFHVWEISGEVQSYRNSIEKAIGRTLTWEKDDIALQNIQARARSPIIWMMANIKNAILITTSNRSEGDVGYATMDGDTSGSLAPIAAVDKHFIRQWLTWAEKELGYSALERINRLSPTAELRPPEFSQTDEKDLMPYPILVEIEKLAIRDHRSPVEVYKSLALKNLASSSELKEYISRFYRLWAKNQWKRERTAPAFHLDDFNIDPKTWCRFPILSNAFSEELDELEQCE